MASWPPGALGILLHTWLSALMMVGQVFCFPFDGVSFSQLRATKVVGPSQFLLQEFWSFIYLFPFYSSFSQGPDPLSAVGIGTQFGQVDSDDMQYLRYTYWDNMSKYGSNSCQGPESQINRLCSSQSCPWSRGTIQRFCLKGTLSSEAGV